jgi:DNA-binding NarL/FixJ family response regulator
MLQEIGTIRKEVLSPDRGCGLSILAGRELTHREQQVWSLMAAGWSDAQIAELLALNPLTVRFHATNAIAKLGPASAPRRSYPGGNGRPANSSSNR